MLWSRSQGKLRASLRLPEEFMHPSPLFLEQGFVPHWAGKGAGSEVHGGADAVMDEQFLCGCN